MIVTYSIFLFGAALAGSIAALSFSGKPGANLKLLLSFSGAYLLALTLLHLLPEIFAHGTGRPGLYILLGFLLQLVLEYFSKGVEHGHIHIHHLHTDTFPWAVFISLSLHSILEGLPLIEGAFDVHSAEAPSHQHHHHSHDNLLMGIVIHKIPESLAMAFLLMHQLNNKKKTMIYMVIYALMAPVGLILGNSLFAAGLLSPTFTVVFLSVVVGIFLHVSTTILFESSENHTFNLRKMLAILLGFSLCWLSL